MKKINSLFTVVLILLLSACSAPKAVQNLDRTIRPKAGPAPAINIGKYESFEMPNGMKVFVVANHKIPRVEYSLMLDNTPVFENDRAGLSMLAGEILRTGTTTKTKDQLDEEIDFIGASLSTSANSMSASALKRHNETLLKLMSDVLMNPAFDAAEFDKLKKQSLSGIQAMHDDPGNISSNVLSKLIYGSTHPYANITTETSLNNIGLDDLKNYYADFFRPNKAYMAIVGDITVAEAKPLIEKYFGQWQAKALTAPVPPKTQAPLQNNVVVVDRPSAVQTTLSLGYPVELKPGLPDAIKASVTNTILGGSWSRLFRNLREKNAFTYGAYSSLSPDRYAGSMKISTEIRNSVTDSALREIVYEMQRLRTEPVPADELNLVKNNMAGGFALALEEPSTIARFAINTARYGLPADYYNNYLKNLAAVTAEDVMQMANKYILPENMHILAVGKSSEIAPKLEPFTGGKPIVFLDFEGNDMAAKTKAPPAGITAADVVSMYVEALGGAEALKKIKDVTTNATAEMQGMKIFFDIYKKDPGRYMMQVRIGNQIMQRDILNGDKAVAQSPANNHQNAITGEHLENMKIDAMIAPELQYDKLGIKTALDGIEKVDGRDAYKVILTYPSGKNAVRYFDVETKLLVLESTDLSRQKFSDYRTVNGVKFPYRIEQSVGPQTVTLVVDQITVNKGLNDILFMITTN